MAYCLSRCQAVFHKGKRRHPPVRYQQRCQLKLIYQIKLVLIGGSFDAKAFDLTNTNLWLRKLKWPRVTEAQLRKVLMGRNNSYA